MACARHVQEFLLLLELSLLALLYAQEDPTGDGSGNSNNNDDSPSTGTIVGFSVVLTFFLLSVCVVIMICFRYGVCKCLKVRPISRSRSNVMIPRERQNSQRVSNPGQQATALPVVQSRPSSVITLQNVQQGDQNRTTSLHIRPTDPPPPYPGMAYPYQPCKPRHTGMTPLHFRLEGQSEHDSIVSSSERFHRSNGMESITSSDQSISRRYAYPPRTPPPSYDTEV